MSDVKTIGIAGGGQLAQMMVQVAAPLGLKIIVADTGANSPAAQAGAQEIIASGGDDQHALHALSQRSDILTMEFEELFDVTQLENIARSGKPVYPQPEIIELIKDKFTQKQFLQAHSVAVGPFAEITDAAQAKELLRRYGGKMVIKTRRGGYDGNGNAVVASEKDIDDSIKHFDGRPLYAEAFVPFAKELAVMIARSTNGETAVYPVVETFQQRNICLEVLAPAQISKTEHEQTESLAIQLAEQLKFVGTFGVELFLTKEGEVLVNEIAPRVHNSGHYTIEACQTSQFEQHLRAITGMPLGDTKLKVPAAVMINILGERNGETKISGVEAAEEIPETYVHLYGKSPTKIDRKMGHITSTGPDIKTARERARQARKFISI